MQRKPPPLVAFTPRATGSAGAFDAQKAVPAAQMGESESGIEPWFKMPYTAAALPPAMLEQWASAAPPADMHLPARNEFLPSDFGLVAKAFHRGGGGGGGAAVAVGSREQVPLGPLQLRKGLLRLGAIVLARSHTAERRM